MVFNFIFFRIKIERGVSSREERIADYQREQYLHETAEAFNMAAAMQPQFVSRV